MPRHKNLDLGPVGHKFIAVATGAWEGKGSWLYKIHCECGWEELADSYDEAHETRLDHRNTSEPIIEWEEDGF